MSNQTAESLYSCDFLCITDVLEDLSIHGTCSLENNLKGIAYLYYIIAARLK